MTIHLSSIIDCFTPTMIGITEEYLLGCEQVIPIQAYQLIEIRDPYIDNALIKFV